MAKDDLLKDLNIQQLSDWFNRAADLALTDRIEGQKPMSGIFLKTYLTNRNPNYVFTMEAPAYLKNFPKVKTTIAFHRKVFLTQEKARLGKGMGNTTYKWVGILPRYQKKPGFPAWNPGSELRMEYESLVEIGSGLPDIIRIQNFGSKVEKDIFASLRGFQIKSEVLLTGRLNLNGKLNITFKSWYCNIIDEYNFNGQEYLTLPNPDFNKIFKGAVSPGKEYITVYHKHTNSLISAKLAAPFKVKTNKWQIIDPNIISNASIDPNKSI